jgi:hypothetical protein
MSRMAVMAACQRRETGCGHTNNQPKRAKAIYNFLHLLFLFFG